MINRETTSKRNLGFKSLLAGTLFAIIAHAVAAAPLGASAASADRTSLDLVSVDPAASADPAGLAATPRKDARPLLPPLPFGKSLHFMAGMAGGFLAAAAIAATHDPQLVGSYPLYLPSVALSAATAAGIGKEVLDSTGFGGAEFSDILITMAGGLTAAAAVAYAEPLFPATPAGRTNSVTLLAATGALLAVPVVIGFIHEIVRSAQRHAAAHEAPKGAQE